MTSIIGHQLYLLRREVWGLTPSAKKPKRRFFGSLSKVGYFQSTFFKVGELARCRSLPSSILTFAYHVKFLACSGFRNKRKNWGIDGMYHNNLVGTLSLTSSKFLFSFFFFSAILTHHTPDMKLHFQISYYLGMHVFYHKAFSMSTKSFSTRRMMMASHYP